MGLDSRHQDVQPPPGRREHHRVADPQDVPDDQPDRRGDAAGQERVHHVGLVVAVGEGERGSPLHSGRQYDRDGLTADRVELDGETAGETVVPADHHVL
ncbi:hypothetical protein [Streptomyces goshikiensis]|uniref:hypothetical protein n=1 Tax=Streptomyces goshikiensis TaxID=1942 RepID=UPI0036B3AA19